MTFYAQLFVEKLDNSVYVTPAGASYLNIWTYPNLFERMGSFRQFSCYVFLCDLTVSFLLLLLSYQNARRTRALATTPFQAPWRGWRIPQLDLQMQISRKFLHMFQVEKILQRLEGQRAKGRSLQVTAQVRGEESLVLEEIQDQLWLQLALFSKVLIVMR